MRFAKTFPVAAAGWIILLSCSVAPRKLDEAVFYQGPSFTLKLVRYHERMPFHFTGEVFRVQCSSARTAGFPGYEMQEAGWVPLGNGSAVGSKSASEVAAVERRKYLVVDDRTLVWIGNGLNVSFDACGEFRGWYPTSIPSEFIDPVDKPSYCAPRGKADCRHFDFLHDRAPRFEDIQVSPQGQVSFVVRSKAIKDPGAFRVQSTDYGRTWKAEPL